MKESVTKFDLEAAFKALDDIDVPASGKGIKANRPALTEIFSQKTKFESLFEDYYDIGNPEELGEAKEAREAEVAKAKLARIEKIVDLDADSPEDLLTSYVGKYIIQCPQCMTLFYKNQEDVVESEDDKTTVNVGEVCQHCGNESGYTLIGKVGEADEETTETPDEVSTEEIPVEETPEEESTEESAEESTEGEEDLGDLDLDGIDLDLEEPVEEEKKEESFTAHEGEALVEDLTDDKELDAKLKAHNEYIEYLRNAISEEEAALEKTDNEQVKAAIQRRVDAFKADLEAALPDEVKTSMESEEVVEDAVETTTEEPVAEVVEEESTEEATAEEVNEEPVEEALDIYGNVLTEALHEEADLEVSAEDFKKLLDSPEFKKPISDVAAKAMLNAGKKEEESGEANESLEEGVGDFFKGIGNDIGNLLKGIGRKVFKNRAERADWVLNMARKDFNKIELDSKGNVIKDDPDNQRFKAYAVYYFTNKLADNTKIENMPSQDAYKDLVPAKAPDYTQEYNKAEAAAIGWSKTMDNGPALIFLIDKKTDQNKAVLCGYFEGKLVNDNLENYYKAIYDSLEGMAKRANGAGAANASELTFKDMKASNIRANMQVKISDETGTVTKVASSRDNKNFIFTVKYPDGAEEPYTVAKTGYVKAAIAIESLENLMNDLEELNEAVLEQFISKSLVEAYSNVTGFKLTGCDYVSDKLIVEGTASFASGNTRRLAYTFTEAFNNEGKIELQGLNEKLGSDKKFTLTGKIENKTLITESFKCNK